MADLVAKRGDFGFFFNFTVLNDDDSVFDLTTYTITIKVWRESTIEVPLFTGVCAPVVPASGTCRYQVASGDLSEQGLFKLELELTKLGVELSTRSYDLDIRGSA